MTTGPRVLSAALAVVLAAAFLTTPINSRSATVLLVGSWHGRQGRFTTISDALAAARPGDWILVAPGDYHENTGSTDALTVTTAGVRIRGMDRDTTVVDGDLPSATPCDPDQAHADLGPDRAGRNGIEVQANDVWVQNLTVCNFLGGDGTGRQLAFDGGSPASGSHLHGFTAGYVTATSTIVGPPDAASYGVFVTNTDGPGSVTYSSATNVADSGFHAGACGDCDTVFSDVDAEHNGIGFTAIDAGGRLVLRNSLITDNTAGVDLASEEDDSSPPPQDGACPADVSKSCTIVRDNTITANDDPLVPGGVLRFIGAGVVLAGAQHDTVTGNTISDQGSYGIVLTPYPWTGTPNSPLAHCQGGDDVAPNQLCLFAAFGNSITHNVLRHNGTFGNPTNGDLADATVGTEPANCFAANQVEATDPPGLDGTCVQQGAPFVGVLGAEIACAVRAFADCHGTVAPVLPVLDQFAQLLHQNDPAIAAGTPADYPAFGTPTAQPARHEQGMPNPCQGVPANPWC